MPEPGLREAAATRLRATARYRHWLLVICCAAFAANAAATDWALLAKAAATDAAGRHDLQNSSFLAATYLLDIQQGSQLSRNAHGLRAGGYELAGGAAVSFKDWYKTRWVDASITWMTQVTENFGVIVGTSTGERAKKYVINPGLKLGVIAQAPVSKNAVLSFRATTILGGELKERSCTADYGDIGGVQEVNCRLAAATLPPAETLKYLLNEKPINRNQVSVMLTWRF